jgi:adenosylmethionine-8-amino-7-oxononanoate aminotransferase
LFIGIELVADRASAQPVSAGLGLPEKIRDKAMDHGLICYPGGGTADGVDGAHVLLAPPFIYEAHHVSELIEKLNLTLGELTYV